MNIKKLIKKYLRSSWYDLEDAIALKGLNILNYLKEKYGEKDAATMMCEFFFICISVDGYLKRNEYDFMRNIYKFDSFEEVGEICKKYRGDKYKDVIKKFITLFTDDLKKEVIELCVIIFCVDGEIDYYESEFLDTICNKKSW